MYKVYILESTKNGRYYVGFTSDMETRLNQHNAGKVKATRFIRPFKVVYTEEYATATEARKREHYLKALKSRRVLENLINEHGPLAQTG